MVERSPAMDERPPSSRTAARQWRAWPCIGQPRAIVCEWSHNTWKQSRSCECGGACATGRSLCDVAVRLATGARLQGGTARRRPTVSPSARAPAPLTQPQQTRVRALHVRVRALACAERASAGASTTNARHAIWSAADVRAATHPLGLCRLQRRLDSSRSLDNDAAAPVHGGLCAEALAAGLEHHSGGWLGGNGHCKGGQCTRL